MAEESDGSRRPRARRRRPAGIALVVVLICAAAGSWALHWEIRRRAAARDALVEAGADCRRRLLRLAEAYAEARATDPESLEGVDPGGMLPWLADEGYCEPAALRCPLQTRPGGHSYRWLPAPPPGVIPPDRCILIYEDRPRHRQHGRPGRNVVFNDGHAAFLPSALFRQAVELQQRAIRQAMGR